MASLAQIARTRAQAITDKLPDVERTDNALGCYFRVRRKIFGQVATVLDPQSEPLTMIVVRPEHAEREALLAIGHPYFSATPGTTVSDESRWSLTRTPIGTRSPSYLLTALG